MWCLPDDHVWEFEDVSMIRGNTLLLIVCQNCRQKKVDV